MLKEMLQVIVGTASKLKTPRKIKVSGAVLGEGSFDGSGDVTINTSQNNIAVLSGSITIPASSVAGEYNGIGTKNISYPTGFTKDNCKIISIETCLPVQGIYSSGSIPNKFIANDAQRGMFPCYVSKNKDFLMLTAYNAINQEATINYSITLLKI